MDSDNFLFNETLAITGDDVSMDSEAGGSNVSTDSLESSLYVFPSYFVVVLSLLYGSISLVAVVGNCLVITVVARNSRMHNVTNFFIANLSLADVLIGVFSVPFQFQAALLQRWDLPAVLCPVAPFVKELTVNVSIFTLAVIAVDRRRVVVTPLRPKCTKSAAMLTMGVVWCFSLVAAIPAATTFRVQYLYNGTVPQCIPNFPIFVLGDASVNSGRIYRLFLLCMQYFLPLVVICRAYFSIIHELWFSKTPGTVMQERDARMRKNKTRVSNKQERDARMRKNKIRVSEKQERDQGK